MYISKRKRREQFAFRALLKILQLEFFDGNRLVMYVSFEDVV